MGQFVWESGVGILAFQTSTSSHGVCLAEFNDSSMPSTMVITGSTSRTCLNSFVDFLDEHLRKKKSNAGHPLSSTCSTKAFHDGMRARVHSLMDASSDDPEAWRGGCRFCEGLDGEPHPHGGQADGQTPHSVLSEKFHA